MKSELSDESYCYLCGSSNKSLVGYYRKVGSKGIIYDCIDVQGRTSHRTLIIVN